jgi:hypothetical protein
LILLIIPTQTGCPDNENKRLADFARQSADRQAEQNEELVRLNREVAAGTKMLVDADSRARQELASLQREFRSQQAEFDRRRDQLEAERAALAQERRREALLAAVLSRLGDLAVCALPLVMGWHLLHCLRSRDYDPAVSQILIEEIMSDEPRLLPRPPSTGLARRSEGASVSETEAT